MSTVQVLAPAKERAMNLLGAIDLDGDGGISKEEFLTIGVKLFNYGDEDNEEQWGMWNDSLSCKYKRFMEIYKLCKKPPFSLIEWLGE